MEELELRNLMSAGNAFQQTNLVSDQPGVAQIQDANLVNAWGIAHGPTGGPFWVSDNGTGVTTFYQGDVNGSPFVQGTFTVSGLGNPTGQVFNTTTDFMIQAGTGAAKPAIYIFVSEDGTITAWNPNVPPPAPSTQAQLVATVPDAVFKGVTIATNSLGSKMGNFIYAADFHGGKIDVFDGQFRPATLDGSFTDPGLPSGYAPFNIQTINGKLYVTYARQDADQHDDARGESRGFIDVFDTDGNLLQRLASGGVLNSPWGLALAPANFGDFSNDLLVGNFGDGRINAYDPTTGQFKGQLKDTSGNTIQIPGLWGLSFGNGMSAGDSNTLYFAAGPDGEQHGLFGSLKLGMEMAHTPTQRLLDGLYQNLLGRNVDDMGQQFWSALLNSGVSSAQVASDIANSVEGLSHQVAQLYQDYLHRTADPDGLAIFTNMLQSGSSVEDVKAIILGSEEYLDNSGGTVTGLLNSMFQDVLNRDPDNAGQAIFAAQLAGGATRSQVAAIIVGSPEAQQNFVHNIYQDLLGRDPQGGEPDFWVNILHQNGHEEDIEASILASSEFQSHAD